MTRLRWSALFLALQAGLLAWQQTPAPAVQEPPEEDVPETQREYAFNPVQAAKELKVGAFYAKKGSHKAALRRYEEALKWDPNSAEAYLRIAETQEKLGSKAAAQEAYRKFLELEADSKRAEAIKKKLKG